MNGAEETGPGQAAVSHEAGNNEGVSSVPLM
jgi:hypothetical protein